MAGHGTLKRGFTLMELVVVLAMAITLIALAVPAMQSQDIVGSEVRRVIADAVRARSHARTTWTSTTLVIDANQGRWRPVGANGIALDGPTADANGWRHLNPSVQFTTNQNFTFLASGKMPSSVSLRFQSGDTTWLLKGHSLTGNLEAQEEVGP